MTKVFFILSAVVIAVSTFFAYQNGREFARVRQAVTVLNVKAQSSLNAVTAVFAEVDKAKADIDRAQQELDTELERVKAQKLKIAQADNDAKRAQDDLDVGNRKLEELRQKLAKLPKGVKPETLVEDINNIKKAIGELQAEAETKKKEVGTEEGKLVEARKSLDDVVRKIEERKRSFDRNSLNARVVAVNPDWGFVIVDAGQRRGITEATKLLITRGTQVIGKLSIVSVEGERTVANIIPESMVAGLSILPGDRVILENLYQ